MSAPKAPAPAKALHYFPFFVRDWLGSNAITLMSPECEATFLRLLLHQWDGNGLPCDPAELRLLTKLNPTQWRKAWAVVSPHFPIDSDGMRRNADLEAKRATSTAKHQQKVEAGLASAKRRQDAARRAEESAATDVGTERPTKRQRSPQQTGNNNSESDSDITASPHGEAVARAREAAAPDLTGDTLARAKELAARFTEPHHRQGVAGYIRSAQFPDAVIADIDGLFSGITAPSMKPVPVEIIGRTVHQMRVAGVPRFSSAVFATFLPRVQRAGDLASQLPGVVSGKREPTFGEALANAAHGDAELTHGA